MSVFVYQPQIAQWRTVILTMVMFVMYLFLENLQTQEDFRDHFDTNKMHKSRYMYALAYVQSTMNAWIFMNLHEFSCL